MNMYWCSCKVLAILVMYLIILEFFQEIFEKKLKYQFQENPSSGSPIPCRWMDRHEKSNSSFSQFCKHKRGFLKCVDFNLSVCYN